METKTVDIHFGLSSLVTKTELEYILEQAQGPLINDRSYELIQDEGKDNWEVWGEGRETWSDPWHLIIRVQYPEEPVAARLRQCRWRGRRRPSQSARRQTAPLGAPDFL